MKLTNLKHRATWTPSNGWIRKWQKNPGDQELAVRAAIQTARKLDVKNVVVVKGNSYGSLVYHIAKTTDDITKYTVRGVRVLVVSYQGEIYQADAA